MKFRSCGGNKVIACRKVACLFQANRGRLKVEPAKILSAGLPHV